MDAIDFDARAHVGAALRGVLEQKRVELGSNDVPGVVGLAKRDKVGVLKRRRKKRRVVRVGREAGNSDKEEKDDGDVHPSRIY